MKKTIWSFATVKDEEDIIESFVRYNMNIFDGVVISDNGSNDNTLDILNKLKKEGYNIDVIVDENKYFDQVAKKNELLQYTINKYHPDFVFSLDADEFVCTTSKDNPRDIIQNLDKNNLYKCRLRNYVLTGKESKELFIPERIKTYRIDNEELKGNFKCFIPDEIYNQGIILEIGAHGVRSNDNNLIEPEYIDNLFIAHYPVRSKFQIINKTIVGRLNNLSIHSREEGLGFHQYQILDQIIESGTIDDETLLDISKTYMLYDKEAKVSYKKEGINLKFCKKLDIKYTKEEDDQKLLTNTLKTSIAIINHMRDTYKELLPKYDQVVNSKAWRIRCKIAKLLKKGEYKNTK